MFSKLCIALSRQVLVESCLMLATFSFFFFSTVAAEGGSCSLDVVTLRKSSAALKSVVSTPIFKRECTETLCAFVYKSPRTFLQKKVLNFSQNAFLKDTLLVEASSRRASKCTLRNWFPLIANRKTKIFDPRRGY